VSGLRHATGRGGVCSKQSSERREEQEAGLTALNTLIQSTARLSPSKIELGNQLDGLRHSTRASTAVQV